VSSFGPWARRAEGYRGTCQRKFCVPVAVKPRRPPSVPLICGVFPDYSSFSVLRGTAMTFTRYCFKKLKCYPDSHSLTVHGRSSILPPVHKEKKYTIHPATRRNLE
jgi:hypothetical protein